MTELTPDEDELYRHAPDNPSDSGDFDSPQRCIVDGEVWPCSSMREHTSR